MTQEEQKKFEGIINEIEKKLVDKKSLWNKTIINLCNRLRNKDPRDLVDLQAEIISQKQNLTEETSEYLIKLSKDSSHKKSLFKSHYEFYKTKYPIKPSTGETAKLVESDLYLHDRKIDLYEEYINFLRDSGKNLDQLNYGVKNKIELINQFGID